MSVLDDQAAESGSRERMVLVLQVAGLLATGWVMYKATLGLQWNRVPIPWMILRATVFSVAACAAGALITLLLAFTAAEWEKEDLIQATLRGSAAAVWFAPSVILLTQLSPVFLAPALVLIVNATHMLYIQWRVAQPPVVEPPRATGLFAAVQLPDRRLWKELWPAMAISFAVQMGASAALLKRPAIAGISLAASVAMLTVFALASRAVKPAKPKTMPRAALGLALTVLLAIGMTLGGMLPSFMRGPAGEGMAGGNAAKDTPGMPGDGPQNLPPASVPGLADAGFPGVILWPEIKPVPTLIAPMPQTVDGATTPALVRPFAIPFSGEYWLYRWPYARPPATSFFERGTPSKLSFSSTDHRPMQMEARHKLDQAVAIGCCSAIRLEILNADRFRGTVTLELVLIDNAGAGSNVTLGRMPVNSSPDLSRDPVIPVPETVEFRVPAEAMGKQFDEFKIVFDRARWRTDKSAKISIERFVLVPR